MAKADDLYGTFGGTPNVQNQGVSNADITTRATPDAFGEQVAQATINAGNQAEDIGNHFATVVSEAKVNDDYANKYAPAAAQLKQQYDSLGGQDKVAGYDNYIKSLRDLNIQYTSEQPGLLGQKAMSGLIDRHITGEIEGASRELVQSQKTFSWKATADMLDANNTMAATNYNNPPLVDSLKSQNDNHIVKQYIDDGHNPNDPASASLISDAQTQATGKMATGMITSALNSGDTQSANDIRAKYSDAIPGYQKLNVDNVIHVANVKQTAADSVDAITTGQPLPPATGAPAVQVRALVANTAKTSEVDPNNALTVLRIESANGQNLGARGTLGQDKESAGKSQEEQAQALCANLKTANGQATAALGRTAEPWEGYAVYQQGAGGGTALLKAAQNEPNTLAIDVLSPLYKNQKDALAALTSNGGNITMSAADFTDHIKQLYNDNAARANCDFSNTDNPGDAITAPHQMPSVTVQPAASPVQAMLNFEKKMPYMINQINSIPNYEDRAGVMAAINQKRQMYQQSATAYSNVLAYQAGQMGVDPNFTSVDQIPPGTRAALAADHPESLKYLAQAAKDNADKALGITGKDMREYGSSFNDLFHQIHAPAGTDGKVNSIADLQANVGQDLTIAGYDRLTKELEGKNTPEGVSEGIMKSALLKVGKDTISPSLGGITKAANEAQYARWLTQVLPAYDEGRAAGKTPVQLLDDHSPDYVGKSIPQFVLSRSQKVANNNKPASGWQNFKSDLIAAGNTPIPGAIGLTNVANSIFGENVTPDSLRQAVLSGKMTRAEGEAEALKRGFIRPNQTPPLAQ